MMIIENPELREKTAVFKDRAQAGSALAAMLKEYDGTDAIVLAIPAGGVPVAAVIAKELKLPLAVAVVSKITFPWNTEAGFGAVAFDGTIQLNEKLVQMVEMNKVAREIQIDKTRRKVKARVERFAAVVRIGDLKKKTAILVDDGIASGFTIKVAAAAVLGKGVARVIIAAPTGHRQALEELASVVEAVYCTNVRGGYSFAVASAYKNWHDVTEDEAIEILRRIKGSPP
jgi:putative phosphoribosyl transferase